MGCTDSKEDDPYGYLVRKYDLDRVKQLIISITKVQFIESTKNEILAIIQKQLASKKISLLNQIDQLKMQIDRKYQKSINRIQQVNPKAIANAQKMHKSRVDDLMGYTDVMKKLYQFKQQSKISLQREQSLALNFLNNFLKEQDQQQKKKIPHLKFYENMEDQDQQSFIKTAKQKNKVTVQRALVQIQKVLEDKCNYENFQPKLQSVVTKRQLNQIQEMADRSFMAGEQRVKGATDCASC